MQLIKLLVYKLLGSVIFLFSSLLAMAQESADKIEMADTLRESGKIYVVVAVLLIIFSGFIVFLVMTDRKISKLEKEINEKQ